MSLASPELYGNDHGLNWSHVPPKEEAMKTLQFFYRILRSNFSQADAYRLAKEARALEVGGRELYLQICT